MSPSLPQFRYHPDPVKTGAIKASPAACVACGQNRGWIYALPIYTAEDVGGGICPWCIADGSAAAKFDATFVDDASIVGEAPQKVVEEITLRTPSYHSWQGEAWLCHCNDACEAHGDATVEDLKQATPEAIDNWMTCFQGTSDDWLKSVSMFENNPIDCCFYKFVCRHCGIVLFTNDYS